MFQVDENAEVSSLTALKQDLDAREPHTVSEVKESHSVFSNINGNMHGFKQEHQQGKHSMSYFVVPCIGYRIRFTREPISVSKNGNLVSKLVHQHTQNSEKGGKPYVEDLTEVDIPELDIHEKIMNNDGFERKIQVKRNVRKLYFVVYFFK